MRSALGCLWISSDFIRKKMAEAIPPDNSQLVCVGELCCPKSLRKESERITLRLCNSSSASELTLNNPSARPIWCDNVVQQVWHLYFLMNQCAIVLLCLAISWLIADLTWAIMSMMGNCLSLPRVNYWLTFKSITIYRGLFTVKMWCY